jgi:hypothetical protein
MDAILSLGSGLVISGVFVCMTVSQGKVWIPSILFLLVGGSLIPMLPPEFIEVAQIMIILALAGIVYGVFTLRRT